MNFQPGDPHLTALYQLLERTRLSNDEVAIRLENARSRTYWKELIPSMWIDQGVASKEIETGFATVSAPDRLVGKFREQGYFQLEPAISSSVTQRMKECIETLKGNDWPPVFAFVYDEFWMAPRVPALVGVLASILGDDYVQTSDIWTNYVGQSAGASGWSPHVDGDYEGKRVTIWIPISDATLNNGCMYLIPRNRAPANYIDTFGKQKSIDFADLSLFLQASQALPALAGSVLCWDYGIIHWGSISNDSGWPRISIGLSFLSLGTRELQRERPLLSTATLPTLEQRLEAIGKAILTYGFREAFMIRYSDLAKQLAFAG